MSYPGGGYPGSGVSFNSSLSVQHHWHSLVQLHFSLLEVVIPVLLPPVVILVALPKVVTLVVPHLQGVDILEVLRHQALAGDIQGLSLMAEHLPLVAPLVVLTPEPLAMGVSPESTPISRPGFRL